MERTYNNWSLDVAKSAMQKYIRRNLLPKALYAMYEMDLFAFLPDARSEGIRSNMIHRLMIIFMEDIGMANIQLWPVISDLIFQALTSREARRAEAPFSSRFCSMRKQECEALSKVVYYLCRSMHSRECSFIKYAFVVYPTLDTPPRQLPDVDAELSKTFPNPLKFSYSTTDKDVVDAGNKLLGALHAGSYAAIHYAHQLSEMQSTGKHMGSTKPAYLIFDLIKAYIQTLGETRSWFMTLLDVAVRWFKELNPIKEDFLTWHLLLCALLRPDSPSNTVCDVDARQLMPIIKRNVLGTSIELEDFVLDMHTKQGKRVGRDSKFFADVSSMVVNEDPNINVLWKVAYLEHKGGDVSHYHLPQPTMEVVHQQDVAQPTPQQVAPEEDSQPTVQVDGPQDVPQPTTQQVEEDGLAWPENESDLDIITRVQLVTSNHHTDTYIARVDGVRYFVKGPFLDAETPDLICGFAALKEQLGLPAISCEMVWMRPDKLQSPLGMRRKTIRTEMYPFVVYECKLTEETIPTITRSSKCWPDTQVIDWSKVTSCREPRLENKTELKSFVKAAIWRALLSIGDAARRNFLWVEEMQQVISVDEDEVSKFSLRLSSADRERVVKEVNKHPNQYEAYIRTLVNELDGDVIAKHRQPLQLLSLGI